MPQQERTSALGLKPSRLPKGASLSWVTTKLVTNALAECQQQETICDKFLRCRCSRNRKREIEQHPWNLSQHRNVVKMKTGFN